jgi:enoyl-CoA hydratase/carnithine racemase
MDIRFEQDGQVLRIIFNRPDHGNAFSDSMITDLTREIEGAEKAAKVIVLRGEGTDFCSGRVPSPSPADPIERRRWGDSVFRCYDAFRLSTVPTVAVVKGRSFGFGCAIAALSDITLADETAQFRLPEMSNKIMPANAMSALIHRLSTKSIAYLALTSETISAQRAKEAGLVSDVVPTSHLEDAVTRITDNMLSMPAVALNGVKEFLRSATNMPVEGAIELARNLHAVINASAEMRKPVDHQ